MSTKLCTDYKVLWSWKTSTSTSTMWPTMTVSLWSNPCIASRSKRSECASNIKPQRFIYEGPQIKFHSVKPNFHTPLWKSFSKEKDERGKEELKPVLIRTLMLICGQGQRPSYTPEAIKAERCWSAWILKAVISLWGSDLGKWEATTLVASTISYQSSFQTSMGYLQALGQEISYGHCTEHSCLYLAVEIYCN